MSLTKVALSLKRSGATSNHNYILSIVPDFSAIIMHFLTVIFVQCPCNSSLYHVTLNTLFCNNNNNNFSGA